MPSPFPGMDPYLEHPRVFPGLHNRLIPRLSDALQAVLPEPYYAEIGDRLWVEYSDRPIEPDVHVRRPDDRDVAESTSATGVATRTEPLVVSEPRAVPSDEFREPFVEIRTLDAGVERVVTTIEILSPTNKRPGERSRSLYLQKQRELLHSQVHLVEIDLLRGGRHTTAVSRETVEERFGPFDYHVCVRRWDRPDDFLVYPFRLRDSLPEIAVPLLPPDSSVAVDLQELLDRVYDAGPYRRSIHYGESPIEPPLSDEDAAWAAECVASTAKR